MFRLSYSISLVLIVQLVFGPIQMVWAQGSPGGGGKGAPAAKGGSAAAAGGKAATPGGTVGVTSVGPAEEQLPGGQALSRAVRPDYVLGPGDSLSVSLWGEYEEKTEVRVAPDGKISLPTIGILDVKGLTLAQTQDLVSAEVKKYYRNVKSGISLTALRVFEVLVLGEVVRPGNYLATPVKRVSEVVASAGGVMPGGSLRQVQIRRNGRIHATADITAFLRNGDQSVNPQLQDGDVILVPSMGENRVSVFVSEVASAAASGSGGVLSEHSVPYLLEVKEGERVSSVIRELGGLSPWWDLEAVFIERASVSPEGTMRIPVNLQQYYLEKDQSQDVLVQGGDQIFIPASIRRVYVAGAVKVSGAFAYLPGRSAEAYIAQAGGLSLVADLDRSFIRRTDGTMEPYFAAAELNNGDSIIVMEKLFKTWQDYFALVGTVTGVILSAVGFYGALTGFGR
jgi:protein involved in polysaccharide export with SLBB domain